MSHNAWPFATISAYDSTGGQTISSASVTINLDATHESDPGYSLSGDIITITDAGRYEVAWAVTAISASGSRAGYSGGLELNSTTPIAGTNGRGYCRSTNGGATFAGKITRTFAASDTVRIRCNRDGHNQDCSTVSGGSRLSLKRLPPN